MKDINKKIKKLRESIEKHNYQYYVLNEPLITDGEWDRLFKNLEKIEKKYPKLIDVNSPTQRVGAKPSENFKTITHSKPMLSLANAMNNNELDLFDQRMKKLLNTNKNIEYMAEPKLDGIGVELVYKNGEFILGLTRGDGYNGEDITQNLRTIRSLPLKLLGDNIPELLEVRGEVFIRKKDFNKLNKKQELYSKQIFANPRNAAAGSLRQLDATITANRPLSIYCYEPGDIKGVNYKTHSEFLEHIKTLGLPINNLIKKISGKTNIINYHNDLEKNRLNLDYEIDGTVFKINNYSLREKAGSRSRSPRWAIAGKFKAQQATSIIKNIDVQVGRTGALTPVARIEPVFVSGVTVTNVTLHNQDEIYRKDIRIGDNVLIERSGDVIPKIIKVISRKNKNAKKYKINTSCPSCGKKARKENDEAIIRCINISCPSQIKARIQHYCSKLAMNIEGLGEKIIEQLINNKLVINIDDLYSIKKNQIANIDRMGDKSASNIIKSIENSKNTTLARFIYALGIRNVGEHTAKVLESNYNLNQFINAKKSDLLKIHEIGQIVANSIIDFWHDEKNINIVNNCLSRGVTIKSTSTPTSNLLNNKIFVFTGALKLLNRTNAKIMVENAGGKTTNTVSTKTTHLVAGDKAGSKLKKAKTLNISIISEQEFLKLINEK